MASLSESYGLVAAACRRVAGESVLTPSEVRVLLAVSEHGPGVRSDALERILLDHPTQIRRALLSLYKHGFAVGVADCGGPRRPGQRSVVTLTDAGRTLVNGIHAQLSSIRDGLVAA